MSLYIFLLVWITAQGPIDIRGIIQSTKKNDLTRFMIYVMEKNALNMRLNRDRCLTQSICAVADMEHLSMWQMAYRPCINSKFYILYNW